MEARVAQMEASLQAMTVDIANLQTDVTQHASQIQSSSDSVVQRVAEMAQPGWDKLAKDNAEAKNEIFAIQVGCQELYNRCEEKHREVESWATKVNEEFSKMQKLKDLPGEVQQYVKTEVASLKNDGDLVKNDMAKLEKDARDAVQTLTKNLAVLRDEVQTKEGAGGGQHDDRRKTRRRRLQARISSRKGDRSRDLGG